jgi:hypothetical protein
MNIELNESQVAQMNRMDREADAGQAGEVVEAGSPLADALTTAVADMDRGDIVDFSIAAMDEDENGQH